MHERETQAPAHVELRGEGGGRAHQDDGHPVHVVGDGLGVRDTEAGPAGTRGRLEAFDQVEEGDGRAGRWGEGRKEGGGDL